MPTHAARNFVLIGYFRRCRVQIGNPSPLAGIGWHTVRVERAAPVRPFQPLTEDPGAGVYGSFDNIFDRKSRMFQLTTPRRAVGVRC